MAYVVDPVPPGLPFNLWFGGAGGFDRRIGARRRPPRAHRRGVEAWRWRRWPWFPVWRGRGRSSGEAGGSGRGAGAAGGVPGGAVPVPGRRGVMRCPGWCDAVLCADGPVTDLARLSLVPGFGRGHGAVYDAAERGPGRYRAAAVGGGVRAAARPGRTGGSGWRSMSVTGCGPRRGPARSGCSATCTGGAGTRGRWCRGGRTRWVAALGPGASVVDGAAGCGADRPG